MSSLAERKGLCRVTGLLEHGIADSDRRTAILNRSSIPLAEIAPTEMLRIDKACKPGKTEKSGKTQSY
jgi:hypothetical protein